jgi:hypothetical protein
MASQSIKESDGLQVVLMGGRHGRTSKYLVGLIAEMYGKWPMAACYF